MLNNEFCNHKFAREITDKWPTNNDEKFPKNLSAFYQNRFTSRDTTLQPTPISFSFNKIEITPDYSQDENKSREREGIINYLYVCQTLDGLSRGRCQNKLSCVLLCRALIDSGRCDIVKPQRDSPGLEPRAN